MRDRAWFERELRATIADLRWLCDHQGKLSATKIRRRWGKLIERQHGLLAYVDEHLASSPLEDTVPEGQALRGPDRTWQRELEELSDSQCDVFVRLVGRFWLGGETDCAQDTGREKISGRVLDSVERKRRRPPGGDVPARLRN